MITSTQGPIDTPSYLDQAWNWLVDKGSSSITIAGILLVGAGMIGAGLLQNFRKRQEDQQLKGS